MIFMFCYAFIDLLMYTFTVLFICRIALVQIYQFKAHTAAIDILIRYVHWFIAFAYLQTH